MLPFVTKVLDRIVSKKLVEDSDSNRVLPRMQSKLRNNHCIVRFLTKVTNDIMRSRDITKTTYINLLDSSKAFGAIKCDLVVTML